MSSTFNGLHPALVPYAEYLLAIAGAEAPQVTSVLRSRAQQARLYRRYLAGQSAYPAAPPGQSYHEYGRAWDMIGDPAVLEMLGRIWQSWGGVWGGPQDPIHFQA